MGSKFSSVCTDKTSVSTNESRTTLQIICAGLDEMGLGYEVLPVQDETKPNDRLIGFGLNGRFGLCKYILVISGSDNRFLVSVKAPFYVPKANCTQAALYLTYVNYEMTIGTFVMDLNDGEVRFKC